jgi:hypothetical protein
VRGAGGASGDELVDRVEFGGDTVVAETAYEQLYGVVVAEQVV